MPYIEKVTRAGRTVLYERSYSSHIHPPGATRSEKMKDTKESQKKINLRKAITELTILMNANFVPGNGNQSYSSAIMKEINEQRRWKRRRGTERYFLTVCVGV